MHLSHFSAALCFDRRFGFPRFYVSDSGKLTWQIMNKKSSKTVFMAAYFCMIRGLL